MTTVIRVELNEWNPKNFVVECDSELLYDKEYLLAYAFPEIDRVRQGPCMQQLEFFLRSGRGRERAAARIVAYIVSRIWCSREGNIREQIPELVVGEGFSKDFIRKVYTKAREYTIRVIEDRVYAAEDRIEKLKEDVESAVAERNLHKIDLRSVMEFKPSSS